MTSLLEASGLSVAYRSAGRSAPLLAVDAVSFVVEAGRTLGIVGESGSGKSSVARALVGLEPLRSGEIRYDGQVLPPAGHAAWRGYRRRVQLILQDPVGSLDPRMTVGASIAEPLRIHEPALGRDEVAARVDALLREMGLESDLGSRYPHQLSGGQCQRVTIARALAPRPRVLICDEPASALDASVQAQVMNLLQALQRDHALALVFISHDLALVRHLAHEVVVLEQGRVVESGPVTAVLDSPRHPRTRRLVDATPGLDVARERARLVRPKSLGDS